MKLKFSLSIGVASFLLSLSVFNGNVFAEELQVTPEIPKENISTMFEDQKDYSSNELIVKFKTGTIATEKKEALNAVQGTEISNLFKGEVSLVSLPKGNELETLAKQLLKQKAVEYVQPNYEVERTFVPKDSGYKNQWYLKKIQMPKAWDQTKGSSTITVAVIDGGVQTNHPDLKGKIVSPYDVVTGRTTVPADMHGTHVAGIIAASINKSGVAGIAPNVKIMPINVFQGSGADTYDIAEGIIYAADKGANVINMSLGSYYYSYITDYATTYAKDLGATIIASAGNDNSSSSTYPASLPSVISISATNNNDTITGFSNFGYNIDLSAPGQDIYSTISGSSYKYLSGTSMAAPVVSGVAALVLSKNPLLSPDQVESILTKSSIDLGTKGWDYYYGYGRVDALKALNQTSAPLSSISASSSFSATGKNKSSISFTAQKGKTVSVFVENSKGTVIKKIVNPKKWNGGKLSTSWDGKQDNGAFAASGTYTIAAKLTNGKENVYKKKTIKLTNKVKPTIKLGSSVVFSPAAQKKLTVSYDVNQKATITAKIYDSKNNLVKTVLNNKSVSSKTNKLEWNGTNTKNKKVKDGTYKLTLSGAGANKIKASNASMTIKIDTAKPSVQLALLSSPFKMDGTSKNAVKVTVKEKVSMTTYVTTDKGVKVKRLTNKQSISSGATTLKWNGKNDQGKIVSEGNYKYQTEIKDAAGNLQTVKSTAFALQDWQKPVVTATKDVSYKNKGNATFSYNLNKAAFVTIEIIDNGKVVRTIEKGVSKKTGANKFIWDGKDQAGNLLPDKKYQYKVTATDKYKNTNSYTGNITVSLTKVDVMYPTVVNYYGADSKIYYKLSQDAKVTIEIYDSYNDKVRTIESVSRKAGINSFAWDGYDDDGYYEYWDYEPYYFVIKAKNASDNETKVKGEINNDKDPNWLVSHGVSFTPVAGYEWEHSKLNLVIDVKEGVEMTLRVYDYFFDDYASDTKVFNLKNGKNNITYTKHDTSDMYYVLEYKDQLGNEYFYGIDEYDYYDFYQSYSTEKSMFKPEMIEPRN